MKILIKNGQVYRNGQVNVEDILIEGEKISQIAKNLDVKANRTIDASGKLVLPGAIDVHTHFSLDLGKFVAVDDFYTGSRAAAFGGTTTIVDHIGFLEKDASLMAMVEKYDSLAKDKALIDYSYHGAIQNASDSHLEEFQDLIDRAIVSLKLYTTYDGRLSDEQILKVLKRAKETGMIIAVHAENHGAIEELRSQAKSQGNTTPDYHAKTRPPQAEAEAINRLIYLSELAGYPKLYFVHVSAKLSIEEIEAAKARGAKNIYVETCPQYLIFDDTEYFKNGPVEGTKFIMAPPLRKPEDQEALWQAIETNLIDVVATDHCPFYFETQKSIYANDFLSAPGGAPGVEERLEVVLTEGKKRKIPYHVLMDILVENPARIYGLYPKKGHIGIDADADVVILNQSPYIIKQANRHSEVDYTNYEGYQSEYKVETVLSRGQVIVEGGNLLAKAGRGQLVKRFI